MNLKSKIRELQGLIGAVGFVAGLAGFVGHLYSPALATFLMSAIWIVGSTLINVLTDPPNKRQRAPPLGSKLSPAASRMVSVPATAQAFTSTTTRPLTRPFRMSAPNPGRSDSVAGWIIASSLSIGRSRAIRPQARTRLS